MPTEEEEERNYGKDHRHGDEAAEQPEHEEFNVKKIGFFDENE